MSFIVITSICYLLNFQATISQADTNLSSINKSIPDTVYVKASESSEGSFLPTVLGGLIAGITGLGVAYFSSLLKRKREKERQKEEYISILYTLYIELANIKSDCEFIRVEVDFIGKRSKSRGKLKGVEAITRLNTDYLKTVRKKLLSYEISNSTIVRDTTILTDYLRKANEKLKYKYLKQLELNVEDKVYFDQNIENLLETGLDPVKRAQDLIPEFSSLIIEELHKYDPELANSLPEL